MALVQVNLGRNSVDLAREMIQDAINRQTTHVMLGNLSEAEYKLEAGLAHGLQKALNILEEARTEVLKEK